MITDEQIKLILQEIRLAVKIGIETHKDAINEGMDDIIESEEMQEYFDNVVEALYDNLDDEIWLEDAKQTRLQEAEEEDDGYDRNDETNPVILETEWDTIRLSDCSIGERVELVIKTTLIEREFKSEADFEKDEDDEDSYTIRS
jgi:hypothetical protein